jgi:hypothetical protein
MTIGEVSFIEAMMASEHIATVRVLVAPHVAVHEQGFANEICRIATLGTISRSK